tara:strand:- start:1709 stop:3628 length:1920 start_codon:yes stop_codon:yes gene_type:complete
MQIRFSFLLFLFFVIYDSFSQGNFLDTVDIPVVTVKSDFKIESEDNSFKKVQIDSIQMSQKSTGTLADVLSEHSTIFVKSYGVGGLSSVSFRGTSAAHTMVLWNDIPINSSLNGQIDFSLIPLAFFDGIEIDFGGASLEKNAGSLGGSVNLQNIVNYNNRLSVAFQQQFASFGNVGTSAIIKVGQERFQSNFRVFRKQGENDFKFTNLGKDGFPEERLQNASVEQFGVLNEYFFKPTRTSEIMLQASVISTDREIPAIMLVNNNRELQNDQAYRATLGYKIEKTNWRLNLKSSGFLDELDYENQLLQTETNTTFSGIKNLAHFNWDIAVQHQLNVKLHADFDEAESETFSEDKTLKRQALFVNYNYSPSDRIKTSAILRTEALTNQPTLLLPALGVVYRLGKESNYLLRLNASMNAKYPNLNDLFWQPGGNPDLQVERSKNLELGIANQYLFIKDWMSWKIEATAYYMLINDYILWQPTAFGYWKSDNLQEVVSRGGEVNWSIRTKWKKLRNTTTVQYGYTSSVNQLAKQENDASKNKQLIYVPEHSMNIFSQFNFKQWQIIYQLNYTGLRYTATDNSDFLPFYNLHNIKVQREMQFKNHQFSVSAQVNNLFDADYQAIQWRPMPGRNFGITLNYSFDK